MTRAPYAIARERSSGWLWSIHTILRGLHSLLDLHSYIVLSAGLANGNPVQVVRVWTFCRFFGI